MQDAELFYRELMGAQTSYLKADAYFRGAPPEIIANPKLRALLGIDTDEFNENYSAIPVKVLASRINLAGFEVPDNPTGSEELRRVWEESLMHLEFEGFIRDTLKYGDGYLEVWIKDDGSVDIVPAPTATSRMLYFAGDLRVKLLFGTLEYITITDNITGLPVEVPLATLKYADRIERWYKESPKPESAWLPYYTETEDELGEEEGWEINPFGEVPAFHFRNETPYGTPAHIDAYGSQNQIVKVIANLMGVIDFAGLPERWALLDSTNPQDMSSFGTPGVDLGNDFSDSSVSTGLGGMSLIKARQTGTYEVAKTSEFLAVKESALKSMSALTDTPMRFFADPSGQHPSGDSLRAADMPLKHKIRQHEFMYGYTLSEALGFAMEILGIDGDLPVIRWQPQSVEIDSELAEVLEMKLRLGIPQKQIFLELGYTDEQIAGWELSRDAEVASAPASSSRAATEV